MKKLLMSSLLMLAAVPLATSADGLTYSYVEGGYARASQTGLNGGGDGFGLGIGANLNRYLFLEGGLQGNAWDTHQAYIEKIYAERDFIHAGLHLSLSDDVDAIFRAGITQVNVSSANAGYPENSKNGYDLGLGLRARLPAGFELEAGVGADDAELVYTAASAKFTPGALADERSERYVTAALRYHVTERFLLGLSYTVRGGAHAGFGESVDMRGLSLAGRWDFY